MVWNSELPANLCRNCGETVSQEFCPACGQKTKTKRLRFKEEYKNLFAHLFFVEGPLLKTLKGIIIKPGKFCLDYIDGKRKGKYKPLPLFVFILAVYVFSFQILDIKMEDFANTFSMEGNPMFETEEGRQVMTEYMAFFQNNLKTLSFIQIPFFAFFAMIFTNGIKLNFIEHFTTSTYISAASMLIGTILMLFVIMFPTSTVMWSITAITFVYMIWAYFDFFKFYYSKPMALFLSFATNIMGYFIFIFIISMLGGIYMGYRMFQLGMFDKV